MPVAAATTDALESNVYRLHPSGRFEEARPSASTRRHPPAADPSEIIGRSAVLQSALTQLGHVARTDATVLLLGETGTGKELFATRLHTLSARCERPMVRVNCAALPPTLIESELFGRERGAFTDAVSRQMARRSFSMKSVICRATCR
jgi:transcriptional regulator with GAF, ATPase, and Fis domain